MIKPLAAAVVTLFFVGVLTPMHAENEPARTAGKAAEPKAGKVLRHVVLFKFKPGTTPEQLTEVVDAFARYGARSTSSTISNTAPT